MTRKKDAITRLMSRYRAQLPTQESFCNRRKMMLDYIALYYDNNKDPETLIARLHHIEQGRCSAHSLLAALAGGAVSCTVMLLCSGHFSPCRLLLSAAVYLLLTAMLAYAVYSVMLLGIRRFAQSDPYFTDEYEGERIREILGEAVDEIAQMRLRL